MEKDKNVVEFTKILIDILNRTTDMVKFGESKNFSLISASTAAIIGIVGIIAANKTIGSFHIIQLTMSALFFFIAVLISIISFRPNMTGPKHQALATSNLMFFGDISTIQLRDFHVALKEKYLPTDGNTVTDGYIGDIINQIHINSVISTKKFRTFKIAYLFSITGFLLLSTSTLVFSFEYIIKNL